jgi:hypothetical protein
MAEFTHNQWPNATTKKTPFDLIMGYTPRTEWMKKPSPVPQIEEQLKELEQVRKTAWDAMLKAQAMLRIKRPGTKKFRPYEEGEQVWLEGTNLKTLYPLAKLGPEWYGPYKVTKCFSNAIYKLGIPQQWKIHNVFHANLLTPYKETELHGPNFSQPPPDLIDGEEEYEVEKIIDMKQKGKGRKMHYLIKWKGYPTSDNSWEPEDSVNAKELIREYQTRRNKAKGRKL